MPSNRETETGVGYPKLSREQINLIIDCLIWEIRQRDLGPNIDLAEETVSHLTGFFTRRWGMPPAIVGRTERLRQISSEHHSS